MNEHGELYHQELIGLLELVWGEGFLSPGGPDEVDRVVAGLDLAGARVLDIGCGVGGVDRHLVRSHAVGHVTGIDVEDTVISIARARAEREGLSDRIDVVTVQPGPLALRAAGFVDVVLTSRHEWHLDVARHELEQMSGPWYEPAVARFGQAFVDHNIDIWRAMIPVLATGEHRPTHLRARKP